jgi:hypothetical protein
MRTITAGWARFRRLRAWAQVAIAAGVVVVGVAAASPKDDEPAARVAAAGSTAPDIADELPFASTSTTAERTTTTTSAAPTTTAAPVTTTTVPNTTTVAPTTTAAPVPPRTEPPVESSGCDPNYSGCVPIASDVDCAGGSGNGPAFVSGPVTVIGSDIYDLDRDDDGFGCEG